ncbi:5-(carboxyamino)imidazole ribonucleotide mutase [Pseudactinotalea sp. Z1739]|uniref:5-(carboxyamino)imidazole ribonucleotide mutase n=1 Tax=Pseudactinotalea sp. Z1739 TaxID=3413028 RepID=UPI003C7B27C3
MTEPTANEEHPPAAGTATHGAEVPGTMATGTTTGTAPGESGGTGQDGRLPQVAVVMGSDTDWPVMGQAVEALAEFGLRAHVDVVSAHRMPHEMVDFGSGAAARGVRVIIAGAGGAAHLPGMLASLTPLPVIGVPVPLAHLDGMDSLLSIVQMPAGVPVATVSVGGARNAGLLAVRVLAAGEDDAAAQLREKMSAFQQDLRAGARAKGERLRAKRNQAPGFSAS